MANPRRPRLARVVTLLAILALLIASVAPMGRASATPAQQAPPVLIRLPIIHRAPGHVAGRVAEAGANAAGITVNLRLWNGTAWTTVATATTTADGRYLLNDPATLSSGQRYQVIYQNVAGQGGRLAWWTTPEITGYARGQMLEVDQFDIAGVSLLAPDPNATATVPATFRWDRRAASPSDSYVLRLYDPADSNPLFESAPVGYADSANLSLMPPGFVPGVSYVWDVLVRSPNGGLGASRPARPVFLAGSGAIFGRVTQGGSAAGGIQVQLRLFNGSAWSTLATANTAADGTYVFHNAPTLAANQRYFVRYDNAGQVQGRLLLWNTRTITSYTAGTSVPIGDFDLADVPLVSPPGNATVGLPAVFQWTRRAATPTDSYLLQVYDPVDRNPRWLSPSLGYTETTTLAGLSSGLAPGALYAWEVVVASPDGGVGVARAARLIRFADGGVAPLAGMDPKGVP